MKEMREKFCSFNDPRPRTRKIRVCIDHVHAIVLYGWKIGPARICEQLLCMISHLFEAHAARHDNQNLRCPLQNIRPGDADRFGSRSPKVVSATGEEDHFWYPVAAAINRVQPLHTKHPR